MLFSYVAKELLDDTEFVIAWGLHSPFENGTFTGLNGVQAEHVRWGNSEPSSLTVNAPEYCTGISSGSVVDFGCDRTYLIALCQRVSRKFFHFIN